MSDWAVGDLAVCVDDSPCQQNPRGEPFGIEAGCVLTVCRVALDRVGDLALFFREIESDCFGWCATRFRKILPDKHEACESEFVDLLKRSKRKVSA